MSSHGIGTSRALQDNPTAGAFSGLAMALNALVTAVVLPLVLVGLPWMLQLRCSAGPSTPCRSATRHHCR